MMRCEADAGEKVLLSRLREGDRHAFQTVYQRHKISIAAAIYRMVKDPELVEDLLQEVFIRLWEHRQRIDPGLPVGGYLHRIAQNLVCDFFRKLSRDKKMQDQVWTRIQPSAISVGERLEDREQQELIHAAINLLPPKRREVYILCKFESKSYEEVSLMLNINMSTVNDHIYKANQFLKKYLATRIVYLLLVGISHIGQVV